MTTLKHAALITLVSLSFSISFAKEKDSFISLKEKTGFTTYQTSKKTFLGKLPSADEIKNLKLLKINTVIDVDFANNDQLEASLKKEHIQYIHAPFPCDKEMTTLCPDVVTKAFNEQKNKKVFVGCTHGTKVGAWYAIHEIKDNHKVREEMTKRAQLLAPPEEKYQEKVKNFISMIIDN